MIGWNHVALTVLYLRLSIRPQLYILYVYSLWQQCNTNIYTRILHHHHYIHNSATYTVVKQWQKLEVRWYYLRGQGFGCWKLYMIIDVLLYASIDAIDDYCTILATTPPCPHTFINTHNVSHIDYRILGKLGEGTFSEVVKVRHKRTSKYFAMKRFKKHFNSYVYIISSALTLNRIIELMKLKHFERFRHCAGLIITQISFNWKKLSCMWWINIRLSNYIYSYNSDGKYGILSLAFELMDNNLYESLSRKGSPPISEHHSKWVMWQIMKALDFVHRYWPTYEILLTRTYHIIVREYFTGTLSQRIF